VSLLSLRQKKKEDPGNNRADQPHLDPSKGEGPNNPRNLVVSKLYTSQKSTLSAKKATNTMGCIRNIASRLSKVFLHLYSALVRYLEC